MLGKLIKNDYTNRLKMIFAIYVAVILDSIGITLLQGIMEHISMPRTIESFMALTIGLLAVAFFGAIPLIIFLSFSDFGKRFFKDQGYLTHTLPVKTSSLMFARMIGDAIMLVGMVLVYAIGGCIIAKDFSIFGVLFEMFADFLTEDIGIGTKAEIALAVILFIAMAFLYVILFQWHYNAAYALGHMHAENKRIMSIVYYVLLYFVFETVAAIILAVIGVFGYNANGGDLDSLSIVNMTFGIVVIMEVIAIAATFFITTKVCQKKLNLE